MRLFSYCILVDDGAAPNPYWGICTLTICKPVIRRVAEVGDWVLGIGSQNVDGVNYSGKLVYAMEITEVLGLSDYDQFCTNSLRGKIPNLNSRDYRKKVGDCIYDFTENSRGTQRLSVHGPANKAKDLRGKHALLSDHFFYFGSNAIPIPERFSLLIRQGQGHQSDKNNPIKFEFIEWLTTKFKPNKLYGEPQVNLRFAEDLKNNCAKVRCDSAAKDEMLLKKLAKRKKH
jgi:hypothetical protein